MAMNYQKREWKIIAKLRIKDLKQSREAIINTLLANRGLKTKEDRKKYFNPIDPHKLSLKELGIDRKSVDKTIKRIIKAKKNREKIYIYGDYDADGICGTAILWEALYSSGFDVLPYIPERFSEGYGVNTDSVLKLKSQNPNLKLVICIDNGITAMDQIGEINKMGMDVLIVDHHLKGEKVPKAFGIIHTSKICGAALAWVLAREILSEIKSDYNVISSLELAAIGTVADQMPLIKENRSIVKYGIEKLCRTKRPGLLALYKESGIIDRSGTIRGDLIAQINTYEINYVIAPRINAMGRIEHGIDSLRLLCTKSKQKADELASKLGLVNKRRQNIVDEVLNHAKGLINLKSKVIILSHESYHEGVIGLAAGKLVEEYYRPAIVISKGKEISKASARSITGFNIIEAIRTLGDLLEGGGGHSMAAGFSIKTDKIEKFISKFEKVASRILTDEILSPKSKIDMEIDFDLIDQELVDKLKQFEPTGLGNPTPVFLTRKVKVIDPRLVGRDGKHLKLKLEQDSIVFEGIGFGLGHLIDKLSSENLVDIIYNLEENLWNGVNIQLKVKDIKTSN